MKDYFRAGFVTAVVVGFLAFGFIPIITGYPETKHDTRDLKITFLFVVGSFISGMLFAYLRKRQGKY
jgi:fructose-specific phosphotransferase system IIC component